MAANTARHRAGRWRAAWALAGVLFAAGGAPAQAPPVPPAPDASEVEIIIFRHLRPGEGGGTLPPGDITPPAPPAATMALSPAQLRLGGTAAQLRRSGRYELLYHGGWVQQVTGQAAARTVELPGDATGSGLGGGITLYRERFTHVLVDLSLADAESTWRLRQSRRLRGSSLQYFDHPRFGAILVVRPAGPPAPGA